MFTALKNFLRRKAENRMQFSLILGFIVFPVVVISVLYIIMIHVFHFS